MARKRVKADNIASEIGKILDQYGDITWNNVDEAIAKVAKKTRLAVANESKQFDSRWGMRKYSRGWRVKNERQGWFLTYIIHQAVHPTQTHLLEYGHSLKPGTPYLEKTKSGKWVKKINQSTRAKAYPHIAPVAEKVPEEVTTEVVSAIQRNS